MTSHDGGGFAVPAALLGVLLCAGSTALSAAQKKQPTVSDAPLVDPYTMGEPAKLARAGCESLGPFPWGDGHDSARIQSALGTRILWVETAHFRLGSTLSEYVVPGDQKDERLKLRGELQLLAERMDGIDPKGRRLDPWLRLHLFADRLERLYADFLDQFGLDEDAFRAPRKSERSPLYMGRGRYLGQPEKFTVLLFQHSSTFGRYQQSFLGGTGIHSRRYHFVSAGSLFYGTAVDQSEELYALDTALHCAVVHSVAQNLVDGFRYYNHDLPFWFREGLGHWFSRRVDPEWNFYSGVTNQTSESREAWKWDVRVRNQVALGHYPAWDKMIAWSDPSSVERRDHLFLWSGVDFLLSSGEAEPMVFLMQIKQPFDRSAATPVEHRMVEAQRKAFSYTWGRSVEEMEAAWKDWVLETYPKK